MFKPNVCNACALPFNDFTSPVALALVALLTLATFAVPAIAEDAEPPAATEAAQLQPETPANLDEVLQSLKRDVLALNRDLFILEEELLFPTNTQVAIFLSLDVGEFFQLDAVEVKLNNREVGSHLYTEQQRDALVRGGVQKLYMGNLKAGEHELVAVFTGRGPNGRDYRRATSLQFEKASEAVQLELVISDSTRTYQPEFAVVEWH